jgi:uncharacterized protein YdhG (YjbR/CyaY superfamily)
MFFILMKGIRKGEFMEKKKADLNSINEYIAAFPRDTQKVLKELRATIKAAAPKAEEKIAYKMACFSQNGNLVLFAAWKNHIGFYGTSYAILEQLKEEAAPYVQPKGTLQFPLDEPLPKKLITKIVKARVIENRDEARRNN